VEHAGHGEIDRSGCLGADCFPVAVDEGLKTPQRQTLPRMAWFKASGTSFQVAVDEGLKTPQRQTLPRMAWFKASGTKANLLGK